MFTIEESSGKKLSEQNIASVKMEARMYVLDKQIIADIKKLDKR